MSESRISRVQRARPLSTPLLRTIDAAANRAVEGSRVAEDYVRFVLDDPNLTAICKRLRHDLVGALQTISAADCHAARDTSADVGTEISTPGEQSRSEIWNVCAANFKRLQQGLRSLEEYAKVSDADLANRFEQLRYRAYTLERATDLTRISLLRLDDVRLYVLVEGGESANTFAELVEVLQKAGVHAIQLRDKGLNDPVLLERARSLREITRNTRTLMFVNDRPDLAVLSHADGVHVGQDELSVKDVRGIVGPRMLVGVSTHSIDQARQAVSDGANLIGVGPTFVSSTKRFDAFPGLVLARAVKEQIRLPAFSIGGINRENLPQVLEAGANRIAVGSAITRAADPAAAARELLDGLVRGQG